MLSHRARRVAASVREAVAVYDYAAGRKMELPGWMRAVLEDTVRQQDEELVRARRRVWTLLDEVQSLEKETWDREDAVEDLGSGTKS